MSEEDFKQRIIDAAAAHHWFVHHDRPARTEKGWRTPIQGDPGFPDLCLARDGVIILAELKSSTGKASAEQSAWLAAAGPHARLWRPSDWPQVLAELSAPRRAAPPSTSRPSRLGVT